MTIQSVYGNQTDGEALSQVNVEGEAPDCDTIEVTLGVTGHQMSRSVTVRKDGTWTARYKSSGSTSLRGFVCGALVSASAQATKGPPVRVDWVGCLGCDEDKGVVDRKLPTSESEENVHKATSDQAPMNAAAETDGDVRSRASDPESEVASDAEIEDANDDGPGRMVRVAVVLSVAGLIVTLAASAYPILVGAMVGTVVAATSAAAAIDRGRSWAMCTLCGVALGCLAVGVLLPLVEVVQLDVYVVAAAIAAAGVSAGAGVAFLRSDSRGAPETSGQPQ